MTGINLVLDFSLQSKNFKTIETPVLFRHGESGEEESVPVGAAGSSSGGAPPHCARPQNF